MGFGWKTFISLEIEATKIHFLQVLTLTLHFLKLLYFFFFSRTNIVEEQLRIIYQAYISLLFLYFKLHHIYL